MLPRSSCSFMTLLPVKRISTQVAQLKMRHSFLPLCQRGHLPHACVPEWGVHGKMMAREEKQTQTHSCKTTRTVRKEFYCGENLKYDAEGTCKGGKLDYWKRQDGERWGANERIQSWKGVWGGKAKASRCATPRPPPTSAGSDTGIH